MKANMGSADKTIRILLAITVGVLCYLGIISGTLAIILGVLAVIFISTSFVSFCPLYLPLVALLGKNQLKESQFKNKKSDSNESLSAFKLL